MSGRICRGCPKMLSCWMCSAPGPRTDEAAAAVRAQAHPSPAKIIAADAEAVLAAGWRGWRAASAWPCGR